MTPTHIVIGLLILGLGLFAWSLVRRLRELARERREKRVPYDRLLASVREIRSDAKLEEPFWGKPYVALEEDGRPVEIRRPSPGRIVVRVLPRGGYAVGLPWVIRWPARWRLFHCFSGWIGRTSLPQHDWSREFEWYLHDGILGFVKDVVVGDELRAPLVVLRSLAGVRWFRVQYHPLDGLRATFDAPAEDLLTRPEHLDSMLHHLRGMMKLLNSEDDALRELMQVIAPSSVAIALKGMPQEPPKGEEEPKKEDLRAAPAEVKKSPTLKIEDLEWADEDGLRLLIKKVNFKTLAHALKASPPAVAARFLPLLAGREHRAVQMVVNQMGPLDSLTTDAYLQPLLAAAQVLSDAGELKTFPPAVPPVPKWDAVRDPPPGPSA